MPGVVLSLNLLGLAGSVYISNKLSFVISVSILVAFVGAMVHTSSISMLTFPGHLLVKLVPAEFVTSKKAVLIKSPGF